MLMTTKHVMASLVLLLASCADAPETEELRSALVQPGDSLSDAVAAAKASGTRVLKLAPGDYPLAATLVIDFPLELRGSQVMLHDDHGWPTGVVAGSETRLLPGPGLVGALVRFGTPAGGVTNDVTVKNVTLQGGTGAVLVVARVQGFVVKSNLLRGGSLGMDVAESSGAIVGNHMTGNGACGACIAAGSPSSPARVEFVGNRSVANGAGGVLVNGGAPTTPAADADHLEVIIKDNDLSNHTAVNFGFGVRIFTIRKDNGLPGDAQYQGHIRAVIKDNRMVGNEMNYVIDAGFPYRQWGSATPRACDPRTYTGTFDIVLRDNDVGPSRIPSVVTFTRITATVNPATLPSWQYLHGATYTIDDPAGELGAFRLDHPANDWAPGPCAGDATAEALGNTLIYNGTTI